MSRDTRSYAQRAWDALIGIADGFVAGTQHFMAARTTDGTVLLPAPGEGTHNAISRIDVSFFGDATSTSTITIHHGEVAGTPTFQAYLVAGQNSFEFTPPRLAPANTAVHVVVSPGGGTAITNVFAGTVVPYPYQTL